MSDFVRGDCHKCKFEITAECVPHSQKMCFPNCYQSTMTKADRIRSMSDEELAGFLNGTDGDFLPTGEALTVSAGEKRWLDWLRQEAQE